MSYWSFIVVNHFSFAERKKDSSIKVKIDPQNNITITVEVDFEKIPRLHNPRV